MVNEPTPVTVNILGREYRVACPPEEKEGLIQAAAYLDGKMRELRGRGRTQGGENVAVMSALNIAYELLTHQASTAKWQAADISPEQDQQISSRLESVNRRIESTLQETRQIEL